MTETTQFTVLWFLFCFFNWLCESTDRITNTTLTFYIWAAAFLVLFGWRPQSPQQTECTAVSLGMHLFRVCSTSWFIQLLALSWCFQVMFGFDFSSTIVKLHPQFGNYIPYIILSIISSFLCGCFSFPQCTGPWNGRQEVCSIIYQCFGWEKRQSCEGSFHFFFFPQWKLYFQSWWNDSHM